MSNPVSDYFLLPGLHTPGLRTLLFAAEPKKLPLFQAAQVYVGERVQASKVHVEVDPASNPVVGDIWG